MRVPSLHDFIQKNICLSTFIVAMTLPVMSFAAESWTQWRGPQQNGVASGETYPREWNEQRGVAWKSPIPGSGGSTPVVSNNLAFVTSGNQEKNTLLAYNINDGSRQWTLNVGADRGGKHKKGSGSNPSAVVDGDLVYAYFRSGDLACATKDGKLVWQTNLQ